MTHSSPPVAVVTGASAGVGKAAAKLLLEQGWRVIGLGRDPGRSAKAQTELAAVGGQRFHMIRADLALVADARRAAGEVAALTDRVRVLINNAGGVADRQIVTTEGNEATFAGNHLGPFVLTNALLPLLRAEAARTPAGTVRILAVSSSGHLQAPGFDWDDLQMMHGFVPGRAYCNAKLANVLFARELGRRLAAEGIVSHAMHPGVVGSNFISHADAGMQAYMRTLDLRPPEEAAQTLAWLATAEVPGRCTGGYFHGFEEVASSEASKDQALAARLWSESEALAARAG